MKTLSSLLLLCFCLCTSLVSAQEEEYGMASYLSDEFNGRMTAYGVAYDRDQLTCAHKRYPYGTVLRVTRIDNNKSVRVTVIDRGPFIRGRVVDLSYRAAEVLDIIDKDPVEVKVVPVTRDVRRADEVPTTTEARNTVEERPRSFDNEDSGSLSTNPKENEAVLTNPVRAAHAEETSSTTSQRPTTPTEAPEAAEPAPARPKPDTSTDTPSQVDAEVTPANDRYQLVGDDYTLNGLYRITLERPKYAGGYGVQVASYTSYENVMQRVADLQAKWFDNVMVSIQPSEGGTQTYRVILGPFQEQKAASRYQQNLLSRYNIKGFVIDLSELNAE